MSAWQQFPSALTTAAMNDHEAEGDEIRILAAEAGLRCVVLVEGVSDAAAVTAAAERTNRDLRAERVRVVPMGGATNISRYLARFGPGRLDLPVAGLYDSAEERYFARALGLTGGPGAVRDALAAAGFLACVEDLEAELIRALGVGRVEEVVRACGDGRHLDTFRRQPAQQDRPPEQQLRRFLGTTSGRKAHYGRALVEAVAPADLPAPLTGLLEAVGARLARRAPG